MAQTFSAKLAITLLARSSMPLQEQLYQRIRTAIAKRQLIAGERLPSARTLASELGVARGTVDTTYARLVGEGYLLTRGPAGTVVSPALQLDVPIRRPIRARARPSLEPPSSEPRPFQMGLPALDLFPRALWARLTARAAKRLGGAGLAYPLPQGLPDLREAIAAYLAVSRGVPCRAEQVIITGGY